MPAESNDRKILLVTNDLGPRSGGIETFILGLIEKLDGSQIAIYTSSQFGDTAFDLELQNKLGVVIYRDRSKILLPTPRVISSIKKIMKVHNSKTIWFGASAPLALMAPNLRKAGATRIVALTHGHEVWWAKVPPFNLAMRRIGNSCDVLSYLGEFTKSAIAKSVGEKVKLVQIAPGISTKYFIPGAKPVELLAKYRIGNRPTLICVGRLVHRKGQDKLIAAMPIIKRAIPDVLLLIIGSGPREKFLRREIAKLHLSNDVQMLGRITYDQLPKHILLGDVFVSPSRSRLAGLEVEGLGIVYLEAGSCGLPVIAGDSGGAPDAVQIGKTGLVVDGRSVNEIADACIELLSNSTKAKEFGASGRIWAVDNWNWDLWGNKFAEVLKG
ncbi:MAG: glycosyltransferase family 1 protein [Actinomycetales bacterium]|nr:MAG: glycosyltransferase family 1 protein [Actinomycetales bacterium]